MNLLRRVLSPLNDVGPAISCKRLFPLQFFESANGDFQQPLTPVAV